MAKRKQKFIAVSECCKSQDVHATTTSVWNWKTQKWEQSDPQKPDYFCDKCVRECDIEMIPISGDHRS